MQHRFRIASTDEFGEAVTVKNMLEEKFPGQKFQIRRTHKGFKVVERKPRSEIESVQSTPTYTKRRKGKRRGVTL